MISVFCHLTGDIQQSIWFRGTNTSNPPLILLHGGPGITEAPPFRHYSSDLEYRYPVIYWEQRRAGRSSPRYTPILMNIDQILRDLDEVAEPVRHRFNRAKVMLLGHSWGTVLGTIYAYRYPDKVAAYVGRGQIADVRPIGSPDEHWWRAEEEIRLQMAQSAAEGKGVKTRSRAASA